MKLKNDKTLKIALTAVFACIVFVLSYFGSFVRIGTVSIALTMIPIVLGGIYIGPWAGAFLGTIFGLTVYFTDATAAPLIAENWFYTFLGCVVRAALAGWIPALLYKLIARKNEMLGTIVASVVGPIVNTVVFLFCMIVLFGDFWSPKAAADGKSLLMWWITAIGVFNFLVEFLTTVVITPILAQPLLALKKLMEQ